jgi:hypothetical protein
MKLYIFKPSKRWRYCGGGLAIIAESFEACQTLISDEKLFYSEAVIPKNQDDFYIWVFVESFDVVGEMSRVVLNDYNWG